MDGENFEIREITVKTYLRYMEIRLKKGEDAELLFMYSLQDGKLDEIDCTSVLVLQYFLIEYLNATVNSKLKHLSNDDVVEVKKSVFDDIDAEEDKALGIIKSDEDDFDNLKNNVMYLIEYAIKKLRISMKSCLNTNLYDLLDFILFNMEFEKE